MGQDRTVHPLVRPVLAWYADQARDLPWRAAPGPVPEPELTDAWGDPVQRARALASLVADVLAVPAGTPVPSYRLPG